MHFLYQTEPSLDYHAKESWQNKGPIHVGRVDCNIRAYGWSDSQIEAYRKLKADEDIELLEAIDYTLKDESDLLGDDLKSIIDEVRKDLGKTLGKEEKEEEKKEKKKSINPFSAIGKGILELTVEPFTGKKDEDEKRPKINKKKLRAYEEDKKAALGKASGYAKLVAWQSYKNYKKAHKMITW